jgi:hypothetical protein
MHTETGTRPLARRKAEGNRWALLLRKSRPDYSSEDDNKNEKSKCEDGNEIEEQAQLCDQHNTDMKLKWGWNSSTKL